MSFPVLYKCLLRVSHDIRKAVIWPVLEYSKFSSMAQWEWRQFLFNCLTSFIFIFCQIVSYCWGSHIRVTPSLLWWVREAGRKTRGAVAPMLCLSPCQSKGWSLQGLPLVRSTSWVRNWEEMIDMTSPVITNNDETERSFS